MEFGVIGIVLYCELDPLMFEISVHIICYSGSAYYML